MLLQSTFLLLLSLPIAYFTVGWLLRWQKGRAVRQFIRSLPVAGADTTNAKQSWVQGGRSIVETGLREFSGPFVLRTSTGPKVVIRKHHTEEFTRSKSISGVETLRIDGFADYPGFEAARVAVEGTLLRDILEHHISKSLAQIRPSIVDEISTAARNSISDSVDWEILNIQHTVGRLATRLVSRATVGARLCADPRWIETAESYARLAFLAASELRQVPALLRPLRHWSMKSCIELRRVAKSARSLIAAELAQRRMGREEQSAEMLPHNEQCDALHWLSQEAASTSEICAAALHLSMIGVQTMSHSLGQTLRLLCEHAHWLPILRDEVQKVVDDCGWSKSALYEMKHVDGFLKETQRLTTGYLSMNSLVTHDVCLRDGTRLPCGTVCVLESRFLDPDTYENPHLFCPERYLDQPGVRSPRRLKLVSTDAEHLGFGYGQRTCPGRFLAADMMKIAFGFLVLHYDWSLMPNCNHPLTMEVESIQLLHPNAEIRCRRVSSI
ncbi:hypothetical protein AC579_9094 [Pseudocercospora musae]|uniref:Cytochrome P450 monooxygenase n=1 Tax=Pseudocercospora musae TaxID=113226 RepID=A0A139I4M5_9PEZI|nr:hypothetical protein AC579_9094 [Pseudocercospora musae]